MGNSGGSIVSNDFSVKGLLRSIGDPGDTPTDQVGQTLLKRLYVLDSNIDKLQGVVRSLDGDIGDQVNKQASVVNGVAIIHTVTAGKNFYLINWGTDGYAGVNAGSAEVYVRNGADVTQFILVRRSLAGNQYGDPIATNTSYPIKIPAGWDIVVSSNVLLLNAGCFIHGWEE